MADPTPKPRSVIRGVPVPARSAIVGLAPWLTAVVLTTLCVVIWQGQVRHERQLLAAHTDDIADEAARRLEMFLETRLGTAELIAQRWAEREDRDFSRQRFEAFGRLLTERVPGYSSIGLSPSGEELGWTIPDGAGTQAAFFSPEDQDLLRTARETGHTVVTAPRVVAEEERGFYALVPLQRQDEFLGYLWLEFLAETLFNECFDHDLRSEFQIAIEDLGEPLYHYQPEPEAPHPREVPLASSATFRVANRVWTLTLAPRPATTEAFVARTNLAILLLGIGMSLGVAALMYLLVRRIEAHWRAREAALREVEERKRAEQTARSMEERYRGVFDSATDGLLVLERHGTIVEANRAAHEMHGYGPDELIGHQVHELFAEGEQHRFDEFVLRLEEIGTVAFETVDVRQDGSRIDVELRGTRLLHRGKPAMLAILTDVTLRNRAIRQRLRLSRKVLMAQEDERSRVSRDLHDGLGQLLTALRFELDWMGRQGGADQPCGDFSEANKLVENAAHELRDICEGLRPPLLDELGLETAIRELAEEHQAHGEFELELDLQLDDAETPLPPEVALTTFRVLQETLHNVRRHADAEHVSVFLSSDPRWLVLRVHDDGKGFEPDQLEEQAGLGIAGMRERALLVGGSIRLRSAPGEGTRIELRVPLTQTDPEARG